MRTCLQGPYERRALSNEGPARAEAKQPDSFIARSSAKQVAHEWVAAIVGKTDDRECRQERERILRDPASKSMHINKTSQGTIQRTIPRKRWRRTGDIAMLLRMMLRDSGTQTYHHPEVSSDLATSVSSGDPK